MTYGLKEMRGLLYRLPGSLFSGLILLAMLFVCAGSLLAQQTVIRQTDQSYTLLFNIDSHNVDTAYCSNDAVLDQIETGLGRLLSVSGVMIDSVVIVSSASPDGRNSYNYRLSAERGQHVYHHLRSLYSGLPEACWILESRGEDWVAFRNILDGDPDQPARKELLAIVDTDYPADEKERQIKRFRQAYAYLADHHLYKLRAVSVTVYASVHDLAPVEPVHALSVGTQLTLNPLSAGTHLIQPALSASAEKKRFRLPPFAVKTNLLYDAALVPNIGLEFFFRERWSVALNWMYAWWKTDRRHYYWRVYGGDVEARYWLGKDGYGYHRSGHHVGVYAQTGTFDFELGGRGYMVDDWGYGGGISYGYSLPVARNLNLDFTLGVGVFHGKCKEYLPIDGRYVWQLTKKMNWVGPTKAEISLVWHIGDRN